MIQYERSSMLIGRMRLVYTAKFIVVIVIVALWFLIGTPSGVNEAYETGLCTSRHGSDEHIVCRFLLTAFAVQLNNKALGDC